MYAFYSVYNIYTISVLNLIIMTINFLLQYILHNYRPSNSCCDIAIAWNIQIASDKEKPFIPGRWMIKFHFGHGIFIYYLWTIWSWTYWAEGSATKEILYTLLRNQWKSAETHRNHHKKSLEIIRWNRLRPPLLINWLPEAGLMVCSSELSHQDCSWRCIACCKMRNIWLFCAFS